MKLNKIIKGLLVLMVTAGVLVGAYLAYQRFTLESQLRNVQICIDLRDLRKIAAFEKKPLTPILKEIRKMGITSIGVFEETLPDANAMGEVYYASGSGILRNKKLSSKFISLIAKGKIGSEKTYIYAPFADSRLRISYELKALLGKDKVKIINGNILEVDETESELRDVGLGISEIQKKYLSKLGFTVIPRVWNDSRYHIGNIDAKINMLKGYELIIFDREEVLGYPDSLPTLAAALQKNNIKYGYIEIVKQDGDNSLKRLMGKNVLRVHSIPEDELKKITRSVAVKRFSRAPLERKVQVLYVRPFLPPQLDAQPVQFNLAYFKEIVEGVKGAGFTIGKPVEVAMDPVRGWQIMLLGAAVIISTLFLLEYFIRISSLWMIVVVAVAWILMALMGTLGYTLLLQKGLAFLAAITFPSYAVITALSKKVPNSPSLMNPMLIILNIIGELYIGIFLLVGLLADYRFMSGVETFPAIKLALIIPMGIVALYFILQQGKGNIKQRLEQFFNIEVKLSVVMIGLLALGALVVLVARSGNFSIPVPGFERSFRGVLETLLYIRPRTKEFLIGYPFLCLAIFFLRRREIKWVWILAAIGSIAPISVINTFCHIHTPLMVSVVRTINGLVLGIIVGAIVWLLAGRFIKE